MNDKTEQSLADALRCTAAGGRAEIINVPGYPLMVRAVDYNTLRADLDRAIVNFGDAAATVCDMRAQLAEAQRELIAKEAERAGLELERNNAQRQHTMQCAINKTDSQRILELTAENEQLREQRNRIGLCIDRALNGGEKDDHEAGLGGRMDAIRALRAQLAEAQAALKTVMRNAELSKEPCGPDPESPAATRNAKFASLASVAAQGLGMVRGPSLTEHLVEAQRDAERGRWLIEHAFRYANVSLGSDMDGNPCVSIEPRFNIPEPTGLEYENGEWSVTDLRAAIDAAKGESNG